jgi:tight adherence protein B
MVLIISLCALAAGLCGAAWALVSRPTRRAEVRSRLAETELYRTAQLRPVEQPVEQPEPAAKELSHVGRAVLSLVDSVLKKRSLSAKIGDDLDRAGVQLRPSEWVAIRLVAAVVLMAVLSALLNNGVLGVLIGAVGGWLVTALWLSARARKRSAHFAEQLPDVLQLVASSLRSGFSLGQALDGVVHDGVQPAAGEIARALTEARLGGEMEDSLDRVATRMRSQDLAWVVMAIRISREVGGNLAEVLMTTVHTVRERGQLARQVRALSAEGRLSAYVLVAMPVGVGLWLFAVRRDYVRPLYTTGPGIAMLVMAVLGLVVGSWWLSRVVKVQV